MASVSMSMPITSAAQKRSVQPLQPSTPQSFINSSPARPSKVGFSSNSKSRGRVEVRASLKEKAVAGLTAAALTASMVVPDVAEAAAGSALTPSLKNFLLSIAAGGVVLAAILGAVIGVSNFDPVKRS